MVQTGDPTGNGKGGISIWGRKFEDEYTEELNIKPEEYFLWQTQALTPMVVSFS